MALSFCTTWILALSWGTSCFYPGEMENSEMIRKLPKLQWWVEYQLARPVYRWRYSSRDGEFGPWITIDELTQRQWRIVN